MNLQQQRLADPNNEFSELRVLTTSPWINPPPCLLRLLQSCSSVNIARNDERVRTEGR